MIASLAGPGPPAHRVWLPPLDEPPPLDELLGPVAPARHAGAGAVRRAARAPVRARRPALPAAARPAGRRPLRRVRAPRRRRRAAGGQVDGAARPSCSALALHPHPGRAGRARARLRRRRRSARSPALPHVGTVADRQQPDLVRRTLAEVGAALDRRERLFREAGIGSVEEFRDPPGRAASSPASRPPTCCSSSTATSRCAREFDDLEARLLRAGRAGPGLRAAPGRVGARRWTELRPALKDLLGSRGRAAARRAAGVRGRPAPRRRRARPPRPRARPRRRARSCSPRPRLARRRRRGRARRRAVAAAWPGPGFAPVRLLPDADRRSTSCPPGRAAGIPLGVDEDRLARVELDPPPSRTCCASPTPRAARPRCCGSSRRGSCAPVHPGAGARDRARRPPADAARRRPGHAPDRLREHRRGRRATAARELAGVAAQRLPGPEVTPRALRERSWWSGPEVYLLVDDYDLVAPPAPRPRTRCSPLAEFLPQAKDVGLHVVVARRCGGAGAGAVRPACSGRLRELGAPGLVLQRQPGRGRAGGVGQAGPQPPGRGVLVDRRRGARRVQLAWPGQDPG